MTVPLFNRWSAGDKVDYITGTSADTQGLLAQVSNQGIVGSNLSLGTATQNAFQKARDEARGLRRRAVIDHVIDENTIRIMCCDNHEILWVKPTELEALDAVSVLSDAVTSKTLREQLGELEAAERTAEASPAGPAPTDA